MTLAALALFAIPAAADTPANYDDPASQRAIALLNGHPCSGPVLMAQVTPAPGAPTPTPKPSTSPTTPPSIGQPGGALNATPFPSGSPGVTPYPVPTPTPTSSGSPGPVFLVRPTGSPSIAPRGEGTPEPTAAPSAVPTLRPGYVAVLADKVTGSTKPGVPGDATGNVHVFYRDEVLVGERAHYDGVRTITVTGDPYIINSTQDTILHADKIAFDTVSQKASLDKGRGESSEGVERGLVYYGAQDFVTDQHGVAHGHNATLSTCDRPRSGYHVTGRTIDVYPGDKIVITKAIMWLGAAAVFFLPKVVIPLRTLDDQRRQPQFFPDMGYNSYQGYYVRARLSFGTTQYYYGYYTLEFYSKQGVTIGYNGTITKKNNRRSTTINFLRVQDRIAQQTNYNIGLNDTENFSQTLHANLAYAYQSAFGPYTQFPPTQSLNASVAHTQLRDSQTYTFTKTSTGTQSDNKSYGFADTRQFAPTLTNSFSANLSRSDNDYGYGTFSSSATGHVTDLVHWATPGMDYEVDFDKSYTTQPTGINKEPELTVRPNQFFPHFIFPLSTTLTIGEYNEPQTPETTPRMDLALNTGPVLYHFFNNDFNASVNVQQYAYGTGDLKASVQQQMSLTSRLGTHMDNIISYNETNYNGPGLVPFSTLDLQNSDNFKNATDTLRFFNSDVYNLSLSFNTSFNREAQPVQYVLMMRPTHTTYLNLQGTFNPGAGQGFYQTAAQLAFPLGIGGYVQFQGNVDWKNKGAIIDKSVYYSRIIGECYEIQLTYNQDSKQVNATINLLAFPSRAVSFGLSNQGIIPSSFNGP